MILYKKLYFFQHWHGISKISWMRWSVATSFRVGVPQNVAISTAAAASRTLKSIEGIIA